MKKLNNPTENFVSRRINQRRVRRWVALLSALVLFLTVNTLKLEADTLERIATCGIEQHVHDESCYDASGALICGLAEHAHTDACFQQRPQRHDLTRVDGFMPLNAKVTLATPMPKLTSNSADGQDAVQAEADYYSDIPTEVGSGIEPPVDEIETELAGEDAAPAVEDAVPLEIVYEDQAEETVQQPEYVINGSAVLLSDILSALGMKASGIQTVGELEGDTFAEDPVNFAVEATQNDYELRVLRDFDAAELGVVTADEVIVITLKNGIAPVEDSDDENPSENDDINIEETHTEETDEEAAADETVDEEAEDSADELTENADDEETGEASDEATVDETEEEAVETVEETETAAVVPEKQIALDFADYDCLADATVYFYAPDRGAVLVNAEELAEADGVHLTVNAPVVLSMEADLGLADLGLAELEAALEEAPEDIDVRIGENPVLFENGVLIISGDGELTVNGVTYSVTNVTLPSRSVESDNIIISTVDDQATLLGVTPAFEDNGEDEGDIYALFAAQMDENIVTATSEEIQVDAIEPAKGLLRSSAMMATTDAAPEAEEAVADAEETVADAEETVEETAETETAEAAVETRTLKVRVYDVSLIREGESVEPDAPIHVETTFDAPLEGENFQLYHIVDGKPEEVDGFVKTDDQGRAIGMSFDTASLSPFAVVYYTVEYEIVNGDVTVKVDFTDIVQNGVDFDQNDVISALNDGVGVSIAELEQGYTEGTDNVVYGELYVDYTTADNKDSLVQKSWGLMDVVSADDGLTVENGEIRVTADGTVVLSDGESTINIKITGYQASVQKVLGDGATIEALGDTELPMGASASYEDLSEKADELAEKFDLIPEQTEEEKKEIGFSAFDVAVNVPSDDYVAEGSFAVTVPHAIEVPENANVTYELFHIHEVDGGMKADLVEDATVEDGKVSFVTDGFSEYVIRYTVDFHYGSETEHIEGGTQVLLSELIEKLNILDLYGNPLTMDQVEDVTFSDETLLTVEKVSGEIEVNGEAVSIENYDFLLTSKEAFDTYENLEIHLFNGDVIRIGVSDASEVDANDGIKTLVSSVTIDAKFDGTGYVFYPDQPYGIHIKFNEVNKANGQFPMNSSFTYQLPTGFVPSGASASNRLPIKLSGGEHAGETVYLNYTINDSGLVTFTWDTTTNPEGFAQLRDALYTSFSLDIECTYGGESGDLNFGNEVIKTATVKTDGHINLGKKGTYNPATNCVDYEVTVNSDGITKNVVVQDAISGTALTYKKDAVATSSLGNAVPTPSSNDNGFSLTIPQMADGETVTIKYSAAVDLSGVTDNGNGSLGTVEQTGNRVRVTRDGTPDGDVEKSGKDFENKISLSDIGKSGTALETDENGHATINWTINANTHANVSMAGHTISDSIDGNSVPMTYNGPGIYVTAYRENGTVACENYLIRWDNENITKTDTSWVWNIPNDSFNQEKLSYVITYTTDADVSDRIIKTKVTNTGTNDIGGSSSGSADVTPPGGGLTARKKVIKTDLTSKKVTWEVSFDVPETGLNSAVIRDTVPSYFQNGQTVAYAVDSYIDGTITITPELAQGESYVVTTEGPDASGKEYVIITFKKTKDQQVVDGLSGTGSKRKLRVQFQTEISDDWVQQAVDHPTDSNALYHTNNADVILNGQTIAVSATTRVDGHEPGMDKMHGSQDIYQINNNKLPAYPYTIVLTGISDDSFDDQGKLILTDTFNSKYLAYYPESEGSKGDNPHIGKIIASNALESQPIWNHQAEGDVNVITNPEPGKINITITRDNIPMTEGGDYYPYYYVYYYLTVKDPIALEKLQAAIQTSENGVYQLLNKVTNEKFGTATSTVNYEIPVIDKSIIKRVDSSVDTERLNDYVYYHNGNYMVDFELDVNPKGLTLGDDEELTLIDDYENLALDYTTFSIQIIDENGNGRALTDADGVTWNRKGNRITATLKNGVHYKITYSARITGEANNEGKVNYSNTVEFFGVKDWESQWQDIRTGGEGTSPTYGITVFKHAKDNASKPLPGAVFELYRYGEQGEADSWQTVPEAKVNDHTGWTYLYDLTTDAQGVAKTTGSLAKTTWYKLVEKTAPTVDGQAYQKKDFAYLFWITDSGEAKYDKYIYLNDDVVAIDNEPVIPEHVDIGVTKTWTNDNGDKTKRGDITVRLYADGVPYSMATDANGDPLPTRDDTVKVLPIKEDGTTDPYTWTNLPGGPVYSVVEDGVPGYTTTYSSKGIQVSGNINVRNKYIPDKTFIHVEKAWSDEIPASSRADDITVQLKRKVSSNGTVQFVLYNGSYLYSSTVPANAVVRIQYKIKDTNNTEGYTLRKGLGVGGEIIKEKATAWGTGDGTVTIEDVTVGAQGVTVQFPNDGFAWSSLKAPPDITIVGGGGGGTYSDDIDFNNENRYYTLSAANGWKLDIDRLVKEDADGQYIYYIEEVGVNDNTETPDEAGYRVTYTNNNGIAGGTGVVADDTIGVRNAPQTVDAEFEKTWTNTISAPSGADEMNNTAKLRVVIQLERWYKDANGVERKDADLFDPITLFGDTTTYTSQGYTDKYSETSAGGNLSAKFSELPKKGHVGGATVEYIYKIVEKRVYLASDTNETDLLKAGVYSVAESTTKNADVYNSTANNTFPTANIDVTKEWKKDENGSIIDGTPDAGVTVTVQLQRRQRDLSNNFDYSGTMVVGDWSNWADVSGKTLTLTSSDWNGQFEGLPVYGTRTEDSAPGGFAIVEYDYRVVETGVTINNKPSDKHYTTTIDVQNVGQNDKSVTITNTETEPQFGSLALSKAVSGTDAKDLFTFVIDFSSSATAVTSGEYDIVWNPVASARPQGMAGRATKIAVGNDGKATIYLIDGETARVDGLPLGATFSITESNIPAGYTKTGPTTTTGIVAEEGSLSEIAFTNVYDETSATPEGIKTLKGRNWKGDTFSFTLTPTGNNTLTAIADGKVKLPVGAAAVSPYTMNGTATRASGSESVTFNFGDITFLEAGSYTFEMKETKESADSIQYATNTVTVTVTVPNKTNGKFATAPVVTYTNSDTTQGVGNNEFVNTYDATTTFTPKAKKVFTKGTFSTNQFTFILTEVADATATTGTEKSRVSVSNSEAVNFPAINYKLADLGGAASKTFYYIVTEDIPEAAKSNNNIDPATGIRYDPTIHHIEVTLTDNGDGTLNKAIKMDGNSVEEAAVVASFTNEQLGSVEVTKTVSGTDLPAGFKITNNYNSDQFTVSNATGTNPYTWKIDNVPLNTTITFTEENIQVDGYSLSVNGTATTATTATASVTWNDKTATASFVNVYTELPGSLKLKKIVNVNGIEVTNTTAANDKALVDGIYTFTVASTTLATQVTKTVTIEFKNGAFKEAKIGDDMVSLADGWVVVNNLPADTYTVTEGETPNGTSLVGDNNLSVVVSKGDTAEVKTASFTNNIDTGNLELTKTVTGKTDTSTEFEFEITLTAPAKVTLASSYTGTVAGTETTFNIVEGKVKVNGNNVKLKHGEKVVINDLPAGTHYKVSEVNVPTGFTPNLNNGEGVIPANNEGTKAKAEVTANNVFAAEDTTTFNVKKNFTGGDLKDKQFSFKLTQVDAENSTTEVTTKLGSPVTVQTTATEGSTQTLNFTLPGTFKFTQDDIGKTFWFMIEEIVPDEAKTSPFIADGVKYANPYQQWVSVTITENNGELVVTKSTTGTNPDAEFTNEQLGKLVVTKTFEGTAVDDLTDAQKEAITFSIAGPTGFTAIENRPLSDASFVKGNGVYTLTLEDIPLGEYTVTESNTTIGNYKLTTAITVDEQSSTEGMATLSAADTKKDIAFTNTYDELIDVEGTKTWLVSGGVTPSNQDIVLKLERKADTDSEWIEVTGAQPTWTGNNYKFEKLDKYYAENAEYEYRVTEVSFKIGDTTYTVNAETGIATPNDATKPNLKLTQSGNNFVNEELTKVKVNKTWNTNGAWPEGYTVEMTLKADGVAVTTTAATNGGVNPATLTSQKTNTTWINLPKFKADGVEFVYTVEETKVLYNGAEVNKEMFTITGNGVLTDGETTYDNTPKKTERHAKKIWEDNNDVNGKRPDEVTFTLKAKVDGTELTDAQMAAEGITTDEQPAAQTLTDWEKKIDWLNLPEYTRAGKKITYDVVESPVTYYTQTGKELAENTYTFTNKLGTAQIEIEGTKSMKGGEAPEKDKYTFTVSSTDAKAPLPSPASVMNSEEGTKFAFAAIPYTIEDWKNGAEVDGVGHEKERTFTYTVQETDSKEDGIVYDTTVYTVVVTLTYDDATGSLTASKVITKPGEGETKVTVDTIGFVNEEVVDIEATKVWKNSDGTDITGKILNASVTLQLQQSTDGGTTWEDVEAAKTISTTDTAMAVWNADWKKLPKYKDGKIIQYKVVEKAATIGGESVLATDAPFDVVVTTGEEYQTISGNNPKATGEIENTLPNTSIAVMKVWKVGENEIVWPKGLTVTVGLYQKVGSGAPVAVTRSADSAEPGTESELVTLILTSDNAGEDKVVERTFANLPVYDEHGNKITYSVKETKINDDEVTETENESMVVRTVTLTTDVKTTVWTVTDGEVSEGKATITNQRQPDKTDIKVVKEWKDADGNTSRTAPENVTITYKIFQTATKDGVPIDEGYPKEVELTSPKGTLPVTVDSVKRWEDTIADLPLESVDTTDKKIISYSYYVVEDAAKDGLYPAQKVENHQDAAGTWTFNIINRLTDADVTKVWKTYDLNDLELTEDVTVTLTLNRYVYYNDAPVAGKEDVPYKTIKMAYTKADNKVTVSEIVGENETVLQTKVLTETDPWKYVYQNLPAEVFIDDDNNAETAEVKAEYRYAWDEPTVPEGFTRALNEQGAIVPKAKKSQTITNVYNPSISLPSTGGPGTTGLYIVGSILTLLALVLLITKKRTEGQGID